MKPLDKTSFYLTYRYWILSSIIFIIAFIHFLFGSLIFFDSDFWEHIAVIRELATHPFSPKHPLFLVDLPHAFFSPYLLGIAIINKITGITTISLFSIFGLINIILFLISLKLFIDINYNKLTAFYALLFILFLWGISPWWFSSFYHFTAFVWTFCYPSFFCMSLSFLSLFIYTKIKKNIIKYYSYHYV